MSPKINLKLWSAAGSVQMQMINISQSWLFKSNLSDPAFYRWALPTYLDQLETDKNTELSFRDVIIVKEKKNSPLDMVGFRTFFCVCGRGGREKKVKHCQRHNGRAFNKVTASICFADQENLLFQRAGVRVLSWDPIVRFGGNLAQLFRHIPWTPVPSFPQIPLLEKSTLKG